MDYTEEFLTVINNEYDYSNVVPIIENITIIVQYVDNVFNQFMALIEEDERKNEKLKYEFQSFQYKKTYGESLEIIIRQKNYNTISCKNFASFNDAINNGQIVNIDSLEIKLELNYKRGNNTNSVDYENTFKVSFKPYEIKFFRKSNHNEKSMNQVENNINDILKRFPVANCIFCVK